MVLTPTYHVFKMYLPFQDATFVPVTFVPAPTLTATSLAASRCDRRQRRIRQAVAGIHESRSRGIRGDRAELAGIQVKSAAGEMLTAPEVDSVNSFGAPNAVARSRLQ